MMVYTKKVAEFTLEIVDSGLKGGTCSQSGPHLRVDCRLSGGV